MQLRLPDGSPAPADAVFTGTAIARQDVPSGARSAQHLDWTFAVDEVRKGPVATARQVVRSGAHGASCGYGFEVGGRYVVYATVVEDRLFTGLCTGTAPVAAQEVPAATGTARTSTSESLTVTG